MDDWRSRTPIGNSRLSGLGKPYYLIYQGYGDVSGALSVIEVFQFREFVREWNHNGVRIYAVPAGFLHRVLAIESMAGFRSVPRTARKRSTNGAHKNERAKED